MQLPTVLFHLSRALVNLILVVRNLVGISPRVSLSICPSNQQIRQQLRLAWIQMTVFAKTHHYHSFVDP